MIARPLVLFLPLVAAWWNAALVVAADPGALQSAFPMQAPVFVAAPGGLVRLPLPPAVRAQCRPDLSDLRLLDAQQREVPFLVDVARGATATSQSVDVTVVEVFREERRREDAPALRRESFVLATPQRFDATGAWSLVVSTGPRDFVRRVEVVQQRQAGETLALVEGRSIFRVAGGSRARTQVELPGLQPGQFVVTLEGEDDAYLSPTFRLERATEATPPARVDVPLVERSRRHEAGRTILVLTRPPGIVPERVRISAATPTLARSVIVRDVLPTGRMTMIGQGTIRRLNADDTEPELEVAVQPAQGEQLEVEILDQDSPALDALVVSAVMREVAIVLTLPAAEGPTGTLLFGGGRARAPHYDIATLAKLLDGQASAARIGEQIPNPAFDDRPLLGFAMRPGAALDPQVFAYRRPISIPLSRTGLARVRLDVADLVAAQPDLADLRVVDAGGRQWAYLLERDAVVASVPLETTPAKNEGRRSRYALIPRWRPLRLSGIEFEIDAGFADRSFTLLGRDEKGAEHRLADGRLRREASAGESVRVAFGDTRVTELALVVENGDEAPLSLSAVRALAPLSELYVAAPPGEYGLLAGDPDADAPQYEIAGLRSTVLGVSAVDATTEPGGPNPAFSRGAAAAHRIAGGRVLPRLALWIVLVLAVVVLTLLTLRLVRRDGSP
ncbi:MAG: hypothetical protein HY899_06630 [Deltaproteobacteria bacterium]|nr:hypothetical protein [Deltaproteobacteria bacterium]